MIYFGFYNQQSKVFMYTGLIIDYTANEDIFKFYEVQPLPTSNLVHPLHRSQKTNQQVLYLDHFCQVYGIYSEELKRKVVNDIPSKLKRKITARLATSQQPFSAIYNPKYLIVYRAEPISPSNYEEVEILKKFYQECHGKLVIKTDSADGYGNTFINQDTFEHFFLELNKIIEKKKPILIEEIIMAKDKKISSPDNPIGIYKRAIVLYNLKLDKIEFFDAYKNCFNISTSTNSHNKELSWTQIKGYLSLSPEKFHERAQKKRLKEGYEKELKFFSSIIRSMENFLSDINNKDNLSHYFLSPRDFKAWKNYLIKEESLQLEISSNRFHPNIPSFFSDKYDKALEKLKQNDSVNYFKNKKSLLKLFPLIDKSTFEELCEFISEDLSNHPQKQSNFHVNSTNKHLNTQVTVKIKKLLDRIICSKKTLSFKDNYLECINKILEDIHCENFLEKNFQILLKSSAKFFFKLNDPIRFYLTLLDLFKLRPNDCNKFRKLEDFIFSALKEEFLTYLKKDIEYLVSVIYIKNKAVKKQDFFEFLEALANSTEEDRKHWLENNLRLLNEDFFKLASQYCFFKDPPIIDPSEAFLPENDDNDFEEAESNEFSKISLS